MDKPEIAGRAPIKVDTVEGKTYFWCSCGKSKKQPFCDGSHSGTSFEPIAFVAKKTGAAYLCACKNTAKAPYCDGAHSKLPE